MNSEAEMASHDETGTQDQPADDDCLMMILIWKTITVKHPNFSLPKQYHHPYVQMNTMNTLETNLPMQFLAQNQTNILSQNSTTTHMYTSKQWS